MDQSDHVRVAAIERAREFASAPLGSRIAENTTVVRKPHLKVSMGILDAMFAHRTRVRIEIAFEPCNSFKFQSFRGHTGPITSLTHLCDFSLLYS